MFFPIEGNPPPKHEKELSTGLPFQNNNFSHGFTKGFIPTIADPVVFERTFSRSIVPVFLMGAHFPRLVQNYSKGAFTSPNPYVHPGGRGLVMPKMET